MWSRENPFNLSWEAGHRKQIKPMTNRFFDAAARPQLREVDNIAPSAMTAKIQALIGKQASSHADSLENTQSKNYEAALMESDEKVKRMLMNQSSTQNPFWKGDQLHKDSAKLQTSLCTELALNRQNVPEDWMRKNVITSFLHYIAGWISCSALSSLYYPIARARVLAARPHPYNEGKKAYYGVIDCFRRHPYTHGVGDLWVGNWYNCLRESSRRACYLGLNECFQSAFLDWLRTLPELTPATPRHRIVDRETHFHLVDTPFRRIDFDAIPAYTYLGTNIAAGVAGSIATSVLWHPIEEARKIQIAYHKVNKVQTDKEMAAIGNAELSGALRRISTTIRHEHPVVTLHLLYNGYTMYFPHYLIPGITLGVFDFLQRHVNPYTRDDKVRADSWRAHPDRDESTWDAKTVGTVDPPFPMSLQLVSSLGFATLTHFLVLPMSTVVQNIFDYRTLRAEILGSPPGFFAGISQIIKTEGFFPNPKMETATGLLKGMRQPSDWIRGMGFAVSMAVYDRVIWHNWIS